MQERERESCCKAVEAQRKNDTIEQRQLSAFGPKKMQDRLGNHFVSVVGIEEER